MERMTYIPERQCQDDMLEETGKWQRTLRQIYWLADGRRETREIALLLHKDVDIVDLAISGMVTSGKIWLRSEKKQIVLHPQELKESFSLIREKDAFAHTFYNRLFEDYPQTKGLFAETDMVRQERSLIATLATVVAGVERGDDLTPVLHQLGEKHRRRHVRAEHYPIIGAVLLETFQEDLGVRFTCEMQVAWSEAFEIISQSMLEA